MNVQTFIFFKHGRIYPVFDEFINQYNSKAVIGPLWHSMTPHGPIKPSVTHHYTLGPSREICQTLWHSKALFCTPWNLMALHGTLWHSMGLYGTAWDSMKLVQGLFLHCIQFIWLCILQYEFCLFLCITREFKIYTV